MKRAPMDSKDLIRVSGMLEIGFKSGRDWISVLDWISKQDCSDRVRNYFYRLVSRLKLDSQDIILLEERNRSDDLLWKMFVEILRQVNRGPQQASLLFKNFSEIAVAVEKLRRKEKSLLFVPRFQTWGAIVMTFGFTIGLPSLAPGLFPTFITQNRPDLFFAGISLIVIGFIVLHLICARPRRHLAPALGISFFFYFLSIHISSGVDLVTSWYRTLDTVSLPKKWREHLSRPGLRLDSMDEFLRELQSKLDGAWPGILTGILWVKASGTGLSLFLREISERETEKILYNWEDEIRKLTMISLLPLGLFVFPGTLYLLIGPQLLELMKTL